MASGAQVLGAGTVIVQADTKLFDDAMKKLPAKAAAQVDLTMRTIQQKMQKKQFALTIETDATKIKKLEGELDTLQRRLNVVKLRAIEMGDAAEKAATRAADAAKRQTDAAARAAQKQANAANRAYANQSGGTKTGGVSRLAVQADTSMFENSINNIKAQIARTRLKLELAIQAGDQGKVDALRGKLDGLQQRLKTVKRSAGDMSDGLKGGSTRGAQALYQLGAAADDLQYGFRGVMNNIPQIAVALGMSGLAGVLSITVTAVYQLYTHWDQIQNLFRETHAIPKAADEVDRLTEEIKKNDKALDDLKDKQRLTNKELQQFNELTAENARLEKERKAAQKEKNALEELEESRTKEEQERGEAFKDAAAGRAPKVQASIEAAMKTEAEDAIDREKRKTQGEIEKLAMSGMPGDQQQPLIEAAQKRLSEFVTRERENSQGEELHRRSRKLMVRATQGDKAAIDYMSRLRHYKGGYELTPVLTEMESQTPEGKKATERRKRNDERTATHLASELAHGVLGRRAMTDTSLQDEKTLESAIRDELTKMGYSDEKQKTLRPDVIEKFHEEHDKRIEDRMMAEGVGEQEARAQLAKEPTKGEKKDLAQEKKDADETLEWLRQKVKDLKKDDTGAQVKLRNELEEYHGLAQKNPNKEVREHASNQLRDMIRTIDDDLDREAQRIATELDKGGKGTIARRALEGGLTGDDVRQGLEREGKSKEEIDALAPRVAKVVTNKRTDDVRQFMATRGLTDEKKARKMLAKEEDEKSASKKREADERVVDQQDRVRDARERVFEIARGEQKAQHMGPTEFAKFALESQLNEGDKQKELINAMVDEAKASRELRDAMKAREKTYATAGSDTGD